VGERVAIRRTHAPATPGPRAPFLAALLLALLAGRAAADRVVLGNGGIEEGEVALDEKAGVLRLGDGEKSIPLERVHLAETDDGDLIWTPGLPERLRAYEMIANRHLADEYMDRAREARRASDWELAWTAANLAERAGAASGRAARLKRRLTRRTSGAGRPDPELRQEVAQLGRYHGELLAQRAERAFANPDDEAGIRILQQALARVPDSPRARKLLADAAPGDFPIEGGPRVWLDWHLEIESQDARVLREPPPPLRRARKKWRKDLHGVRAGPILLVTPVRDARVVGRCLATGRLACRVLDELFRTEKPRRTVYRPLTVFLYESRKEYQTTSGTGRPIRDPAFLEWTAGHYSLVDGISRFFWLPDPAAERRIIGTCVHELTHHWFSERNPRTTRKGAPGLPGAWIVEGFATLMEEGIYDVGTGEWSLFNPRARSLDVLQSADPRMLVDWGRFFSMTKGHLAMLPPDNELKVVLRWRLRPTIVSTRRMFYEQAAAVCQFLYHGEGGRHRDRLIEFACNYYEIRRNQLTPQQAFGMSGAELGKKTVAFAKAVANGWTPDPARDDE